MPRGFLCLILLLCPGVRCLSAAQGGAAWVSRTWQADEGLPDNRVVGLAQTKDGFLWVATRGGLVRFHGAGFESFNLTAIDGIIGNGARSMFHDVRGNLWLAGLRETVFRVGRDRTRVFGAAQGVPAGQFTGFAETSDGTVWLGIGGRLLCVREGVLKELAVPWQAQQGPRVCLAVDGRGRLWCAANGMLGQVTGDTFVQHQGFDSAELSLSASRTGGLWLSSRATVYALDDSGAVKSRHDLPSGVRVQCLLEGTGGRLWIGTSAHGLYLLEQGRLERVETSHQQVSALYEDREESLWVGTFGGGLSRLRPRVLDLQGTQAGLPSESVSSVCQDADGETWSVMSNGQLLRGDGNTWSAVATGSLWPGGAAACVAADRAGTVWVGMRGFGLCELRPREGTHRTWLLRDGLPSLSVRALLVASDDSLWFATNAPAMLCQLRSGVVREFPLPKGVRNVRSLVQDASGVIWLGTSDGQVLRFDGSAVTGVAALQGTSTRSVRCLHATLDGSLWIGYDERGLWRYRDGVLARLPAEGALDDDMVEQIASDRKGMLWLAGARGLYLVSLDEAAEVAAGRLPRLSPRRFGRGDGLPSLQPHYENSPSSCLLSDGRILFATSLGVLSVVPARLHENPVPPPVQIQRVIVDERVAALGDSGSPLRGTLAAGLPDCAVSGLKLDLAPDHRRIVIEFAALTFAAPENVRFRHRLEGVDAAWSEPGAARSAQYSRLASGSYRFQVAACNEAGVWNEVGTGLLLVVPPFFWQTWWFRVLLFLAFTGALVAIVRLVSFRMLQARLRQAEQQAALSRDRTRIARDIHDDLGGSLAHIKLLSEIASQEKGMPPESAKHVSQITQTTQQVMRSLDEIVWAINPRNDTAPHLISYLGQHTVEFLRAAGISCNVDLPETPPELVVSSDQRHHLFLAVKEALTNVVRHSAARSVTLRVRLEDNLLSIELVDDGRGFAQAPDDAMADGLRNMHQRLESLGGQFELESRPGEGTRLRFELRLKKHP